MRAQLINRLIVILALVGLFVAGVLSYSHLGGVEVPCLQGGGGGCSLVTRSPAGTLFGFLPVAFLGLAGYGLLLGLALSRWGGSRAWWAKSSTFGFWLTGLGSAYSLYLQIYSITQLRQLCEWCLGSAATMLALFVVHGLLVQSGAPEGDGESVLPDSARRPEMTLALVGAVVALGGVGVVATQMQERVASFFSGIKVDAVDVSEILPEDSRMKGDADAKVTVVEFADVICPACRGTYPLLRAEFERYGGRLRIGYRHLPLFAADGHETALPAAMMAEFAAMEGKYFEFLNRVFDPTNAQRVRAEAGLFGIAGEVGLDRRRLREMMDPDNDTTLLDRVNADLVFATQTLQIQGTPTFILIVEGQAPQAMGWSQLEAALKSPDIQALLR